MAFEQSSGEVGDLQGFLNEHFIPSGTPSILDPSEWALARDFLLAASPSNIIDSCGPSSFDPYPYSSFGYLPASPVSSSLSFDSMDSSFDPCTAWPIGNGTPFEDRFASVVAAYPAEYCNSVSVFDFSSSAPLPAAPACEQTAIPPTSSIKGPASAVSPAASSTMSAAASDSEWEPSRRLKESLRDQPLSPRTSTPRRNSGHQSSKAQALGKSAFYLKRELASIEEHGQQLFGEGMCDQCRESPAKLDCIHQPGKACTSCIRNRRKEACSLLNRAGSAEAGAAPVPAVVSVESSPTPTPVAVDRFQHAFTTQPSVETMAGTRLALGELMDDVLGLQRRAAAIGTTLEKLIQSLSSSSF